MKHLLLTTILVFAGSYAASASAQEKSCARCKAMADLENQFSALDYFDPASHKLAEDVLLSKVFPFIEDVRSRLKKQPVEEYRALVLLIAAANPYDSASGLAEELEALTFGHSRIRKTYDKTLAEIGDSCRRELLARKVREIRCVGNLRDSGRYETGKDGDAAMKCIEKPVFDFDECLSRNSKSGKAPASTKRK
ncbi:MAG: hypothetical protein HC902_14560 [Calothrix sp. SM1_5_4]|nr:hypothetical protein [Calothrix sp. SM1_5_4]